MIRNAIKYGLSAPKLTLSFLIYIFLIFLVNVNFDMKEMLGMVKDGPTIIGFYAGTSMALIIKFLLSAGIVIVFHSNINNLGVTRPEVIKKFFSKSLSLILFSLMIFSLVIFYAVIIMFFIKIAQPASPAFLFTSHLISIPVSILILLPFIFWPFSAITSDKGFLASFKEAAKLARGHYLAILGIIVIYITACLLTYFLSLIIKIDGLNKLFLFIKGGFLYSSVASLTQLFNILKERNP